MPKALALIFLQHTDTIDIGGMGVVNLYSGKRDRFIPIEYREKKGSPGELLPCDRCLPVGKTTKEADA